VSLKLSARLVPAVLLAVVFAAALLAPVISQYDPLDQDVERRLLPPSREHPFGTDGFGRDVLARVLHGGRVSVYVGITSVGLACAIGVAFGIGSAYGGGVIDLLSGRLTDVFLGFPNLVLALVIVVALGSSPTTVGLAIAAVLTPRVIRIARAGALAAMQEPYIDAARTIGAGGLRIVVRHLLPNSIRPVLDQVTGYFSTAIGTEAILSYLGLGVPPPYPSWGRMIQEGARLYFETAPWLVVFPGAALVITVVSFAIFADKAIRPDAPASSLRIWRSR
jgi:peptide/nickel transport system permease protein